MLKKIRTVLSSEAVGVLVRLRSWVGSLFSHGEKLGSVNGSTENEGGKCGKMSRGNMLGCC